MLCPKALLNQQIDDVYINTLKTNYFFLRQETCAVFYPVDNKLIGNLNPAFWERCTRDNN